MHKFLHRWGLASLSEWGSIGLGQCGGGASDGWPAGPAPRSGPRSDWLSAAVCIITTSSGCSTILVTGLLYREISYFELDLQLRSKVQCYGLGTVLAAFFKTERSSINISHALFSVGTFIHLINLHNNSLKQADNCSHFTGGKTKI